ncbi:MAG: Fe-S-binding domain-containing protein, partial [Terriglobales bacterium]
IGLYPKPFFQILEQPVNQIVQTIHSNSNPNAPVNAQAEPRELKPALVGASSGTAEAAASRTARPKVSN